MSLRECSLKSSTKLDLLHPSESVEMLWLAVPLVMLMLTTTMWLMVSHLFLAFITYSPPLLSFSCINWNVKRYIYTLTFMSTSPSKLDMIELLIMFFLVFVCDLYLLLIIHNIVVCAIQILIYFLSWACLGYPQQQLDQGQAMPCHVVSTWSQLEKEWCW